MKMGSGTVAREENEVETVRTVETGGNSPPLESLAVPFQVRQRSSIVPRLNDYKTWGKILSPTKSESKSDNHEAWPRGCPRWRFRASPLSS